MLHALHNFDFDLEDKLVSISARICEPNCIKCNKAKISRLEGRIKLFLYEEMAKLNANCIQERFYDACDGDSNPFAAKRHFSNKKVAIRKFAILEREKRKRNIKTKEAICAPVRKILTIDEYIISKQNDELLRFKRKLEIGSSSTPSSSRSTSPLASKPIITKVPATPARNEYRISLCDVDVATLNAYRRCFDIESTLKRMHEKKLLQEKLQESIRIKSELCNDKKLEEEKAITSELPITITQCDFNRSTNEEPTNLIVSTGESVTANDNVVAPNSLSCSSSTSLFGESTLKMVTERLPTTQGNPLFAPKPGNFDILKNTVELPKNFVFGQSSSSQAQPTLPHHVATACMPFGQHNAFGPQFTPSGMQQHIPMTDISQFGQTAPKGFSIPGFGTSVPKVDTTINPFAAQFTQSSSRRGYRTRGGRRL